jgi:hypothetical protein
MNIWEASICEIGSHLWRSRTHGSESVDSVTWLYLPIGSTSRMNVFNGQLHVLREAW